VPLDIVAVPAFSDNYLWLVHDSESGETAAIDPGDGEALLAAAGERGWTVDKIFNTHWHPDHTGGNERVKAAGATVYGPAAERERIATIDMPLAEGDTVAIGAHVARVWEVPGHTSGHIAYVFEADGVAFVGDTLFAMGCGRLFEGTPGQMFDSLQRLASLPPATRLYPAHEYTLANARFAAEAEPGNDETMARLARVEAMRAEGRMTVPTTVAEERATNPFVRAADVEAFARLRAWKDCF
jgi:hydroxyacylglutathione hydrolase